MHGLRRLPWRRSVPGPGYGAGGNARRLIQAAAPVKRLRRVMAEKKIAGVCAGFAEYFDMDVTLVRLIWVGLVLLPPVARRDYLHRRVDYPAKRLITSLGSGQDGCPGVWPRRRLDHPPVNCGPMRWERQ